MKKIFRIVLGMVLIIFMLCTLIACGNESAVTSGKTNESSVNQEIYAIYKIYKESGGELTYEKWLATIKGDKGDPGEKGADGITPTVEINTDGYWVINGTVTNVKAQGEQGEQGLQGEKGDDGLTPYIGDNGNWWIGDIDTNKKAAVTEEDIFFSGKCGNLSWTLYKTGKLVISGQGKMPDGIKPWDEFDCLITELVIEEGVTSICDAFDTCISLTKIVVPASVTSLSGALTTSFIPFLPSLTSLYFVGDLVSWCKIGSIYSDLLQLGSKLYINNETISGDVVLPEDVTTIPDFTFRNAEITSITLPNSLRRIGKDAFYDCTALESVYINNIAAWCGIAFDDYEANPLQCAHNLYIDNKLVTDLVIPDGITGIAPYTFGGATCLTSVTIPDSVTGIGDDAFDSCTGLTSLTIGNMVRIIGENAFHNCTSLQNVTIPNSVQAIGACAFGECENLQKVYYTGDIASWCEIEFGIPSHGPYPQSSLTAFIYEAWRESQANPLYYAHYLYVNDQLITELMIPEEVTEIKDFAFVGAAITSVSIPSSVETIGVCAFAGCYGLTDAVISVGLREIDIAAFALCDSLSDLTIPLSVNTIGALIFYGKETDVSITYLGTESQWSEVYKGFIPGTSVHWDRFPYIFRFIIHCTDGDIEL